LEFKDKIGHFLEQKIHPERIVMAEKLLVDCRSSLPLHSWKEFEESWASDGESILEKGAILEVIGSVLEVVLERS
jgi:hypothetical protein